MLTHSNSTTQRVVLITGGARMGASIARALTAPHTCFIFTYRRSRSAIEQTIATLNHEGLQAEAVLCDFARRASIEKLIQHIARRYRRLDGIVHMASIYEEVPLAGAQAVSGWQSHMNAHAEASFYLCHAAAPLMKRIGGGKMVLIADWTAASGRPRYKGFTPYYVSKLAVKGIAEAMALELAPDIQVNAIAPGPILPPPGMSKREIKKVIEATPLKRWGGPEEIAKTVRYLWESDFVTGETIRVDGGRHLY